MVAPCYRPGIAQRACPNAELVQRARRRIPVHLLVKRNLKSISAALLSAETNGKGRQPLPCLDTRPYKASN